MELDLRQVLDEVLVAYTLPWNGCHGLAHWARVLENGLRLAPLTGASAEVVALFAVLHDSRRVSEGTDPKHGPLAALLAESLRGHAFDLPDHEFSLLRRACAGHTHERTHPDVTIRTCWDSDRLDLGRVGITPHPRYLGTEAARSAEILDWAHGRACFGVVPDLIETSWGIDLRSSR